MAYEKKKFAPIRCDNCGKEFTPRIGNQRFCSRKCSDLKWQADRAAARRASLRVRKCAQCGKEFQPRTGNQIYCCRSCGIVANREEAKRFYPAPAPPEKNAAKKNTENMREIARLAKNARERGVSYGRYVADHGTV